MCHKIAVAVCAVAITCGVAQTQEIIFKDGFESGWVGRWSNAPWTPLLYIWEVDADTTGTDEDEFIELRNRTGFAIDFADEQYYLLFINGNDDLTYDAYQLTGSLAIDGLYLLDSLPSDSIQNGPDGVMVVRCDLCTDVTADFPTDLDVGYSSTFLTGNGNTAIKIDALAYDTDDADDIELMAKLGVLYQFNENANGNKDFESNNRVDFDLFSAVLATPGVP